jgi:hypothetical protein
MSAWEREVARDEWTRYRFIRGVPALRTDACTVRWNIDQSGNAINEKIEATLERPNSANRFDPRTTEFEIRIVEITASYDWTEGRGPYGLSWKAHTGDGARPEPPSVVITSEN